MGFPVFNFDDFLGENDLGHPENSPVLCPKFWDKYKNAGGKIKWELDPIVKKKLLRISEGFVQNIEDSTGHKCDVSDIRLVGPMCGPKYSEDSPLEIEIIFDLDSHGESKGLMAEKINHHAFLWHSKPETTLRGHEVELEVLGEGESRSKSGVYSLSESKWKKLPNFEEHDNFILDEKSAINVCYLIEKLERIQRSDFSNQDVENQVIKKVQSKLGKLRKKAFNSPSKSLLERSAYQKLLEGGYIKRLIKILDQNHK